MSRRTEKALTEEWGTWGQNGLFLVIAFYKLQIFFYMLFKTHKTFN